MTDPFVQGSPPTLSGHATIDDDAELYYELRGQAPQKVLMIMGAFATSRKFDCIASEVAAAGYEVLSYHHRNIGKTKSPASKWIAQTPRSLAEDAVALANAVWGATTPLHVVGASLGGVIAQHTALLLQQQQRLCSLLLCVTWDGSSRLGNSLTGRALRSVLSLPVVRHVVVPLLFPHRNNADKQAAATMRSVCTLLTT